MPSRWYLECKTHGRGVSVALQSEGPDRSQLARAPWCRATEDLVVEHLREVQVRGTREVAVEADRYAGQHRVVLRDDARVVLFTDYRMSRTQAAEFAAELLEFLNSDGWVHPVPTPASTFEQRRRQPRDFDRVYLVQHQERGVLKVGVSAVETRVAHWASLGFRLVHQWSGLTPEQSLAAEGAAVAWWRANGWLPVLQPWEGGASESVADHRLAGTVTLLRAHLGDPD